MLAAPLNTSLPHRAVSGAGGGEVTAPRPCLQAVAYALSEQARQLMQPGNRANNVNPSTRALGAIVEAALVAVPAALVEAIVLNGLQREEAQMWRAAMGCDLISDKVATVLQQLHEARAVAGESLVKVPRRSPCGRGARGLSARRRRCMHPRCWTPAG